MTNEVIDILAAFARKQANAHQVMRTLMLHGDWLVPSVFAARALGRETQELAMFGQEIAHPAGTLLIYSDIDTAMRAYEEQQLALGPFARGVLGIEIFAALPADLRCVVINEGAALEKKLYLNAPSFGNAAVWADVLMFELELADDQMPELERLSRVRAYDAYFTAMHAHNSSIVTLVNYKGLANAGVLFTAPDCLETFLEAVPAPDSMQSGQTSGERVMSMLPHLGIDGIVINPMGPGVSATFSVADLTRA